MELIFVVFPSSRVYKQLVALKEPSEQGWLVSHVAKGDIKTVRRKMGESVCMYVLYTCHDSIIFCMKKWGGELE